MDPQRTSQEVKTIEELKENAWVKFTGTGAPAETAGQALEGGKDPEVSPSDYAQFLTVLEPYTFDILVYDGTDSAHHAGHGVLREARFGECGLKVPGRDGWGRDQ